MAGPPLVDAGPTRDHVNYLYSQGWNQAEVARGAKVSKGTIHDIMDGSRVMIQRRCANSIARLRDEEGEGDRRLFSAEPLRQATLKSHNFKLLSSGIARQIYRLCEGDGELTAKQADYWAVKIGKHPHEIWPNWYDDEVLV